METNLNDLFIKGISPNQMKRYQFRDLDDWSNKINQQTLKTIPRVQSSNYNISANNLINNSRNDQPAISKISFIKEVATNNNFNNKHNVSGIKYQQYQEKEPSFLRDSNKIKSSPNNKNIDNLDDFNSISLILSQKIGIQQQQELNEVEQINNFNGQEIDISPINQQSKNDLIQKLQQIEKSDDIFTFSDQEQKQSSPNTKKQFNIPLKKHKPNLNNNTGIKNNKGDSINNEFDDIDFMKGNNLVQKQDIKINSNSNPSLSPPKNKYVFLPDLLSSNNNNINNNSHNSKLINYIQNPYSPQRTSPRTYNKKGYSPKKYLSKNRSFLSNNNKEASPFRKKALKETAFIINGSFQTSKQFPDSLIQKHQQQLQQYQLQQSSHMNQSPRFVKTTGNIIMEGVNSGENQHQDENYQYYQQQEYQQDYQELNQEYQKFQMHDSIQKNNSWKQISSSPLDANKQDVIINETILKDTFQKMSQEGNRTSFMYTKEEFQRSKETHFKVYQAMRLLQKEMKYKDPQKMGDLFINLLDIMTNEKGIFQEVLLFIKILVGDMLFCLDESIYDQVFKITGEVIVKKRMPYSFLLQKVVLNYERIKDKGNKIMHEALELEKKKNLELEEIKKQNSELISQIKEQDIIIQSNKQLEEKRILIETKQMKQTINLLNIKITNLSQELIHQRIDSDIEKHQSSNEFSILIQDLRKRKLDQEMEILEKEKEWQKFKIMFDSMKDQNSKGLFVLRNASAQIKDLEQKLKKLQLENERLIQHSQVSYDDFTPRPSINKLLDLYETNDLDKNFFQQATQVKINIISSGLQRFIEDQNIKILQSKDKITSLEESNTVLQNSKNNDNQFTKPSSYKRQSTLSKVFSQSGQGTPKNNSVLSQIQKFSQMTSNINNNKISKFNEQQDGNGVNELIQEDQQTENEENSESNEENLKFHIQQDSISSLSFSQQQQINLKIGSIYSAEELQRQQQQNIASIQQSIDFESKPAELSNFSRNIQNKADKYSVDSDDKLTERPAGIRVYHDGKTFDTFTTMPAGQQSIQNIEDTHQRNK